MAARLLMASWWLSAAIFCGAVQAQEAVPATTEQAEAPAVAPAGEDTDITYSLEKLLNLKMTVSSKKETTIRDQPGIVTVVTRDQMLAIGARDLKDILRVMVPGFAIISDVEVPMTLAVRGLSTMEGKVSVQLDGHELNETKYGTVQFYNTFPVDFIDRIEIIRGPGSAIYGGYAQLAVINIVTRNASLNGGYADMAVEGGSSGLLQHRVAGGFGNNASDFKYAANVVASNSTFSATKTYKTYEGGTEDMSKTQLKVKNYHFDFDLAKGDTAFKGIVDLLRQPYYYFSEPDAFNWYETFDRHETYLGAVKHTLHLGAHTTLTPEYEWKDQKAFFVDDTVPDFWSRNRTDRKMGTLMLSHDFDDKTNVLFGMQRYVSAVRRPHHPISEEAGYGGAKGHVSYWNNALILQLMSFNDIVNVTLGLRYDKTDIFGENTAPRLVLTKTIDRFHTKFQVAQSFKVPGGVIMVLADRKNADIDIQPEKAVNLELEMGYRFGDNVWFVTNLYDISVKGLHVYEVNDPTDPNATGFFGKYTNGGKIGTRGFETELRVAEANWDMELNFAQYRLKQDESNKYIVPGHADAALSSPNQQAGFAAGYKFTRDFGVNLNGLFRGARYSITGQDDAEAPIIGTFGPDTVFNLSSRWKRVAGIKGFALDATLHNLTDEPQEAGGFLNNSNSPFPGLERSMELAANYDF